MLLRRKRTRTHMRDRSPRAVLIRQIAAGGLILLLAILLGLGVWYGTRIESLTISSVQIEGGETIPHETVRAIAKEHLDGSYFKLIPHRFAWLYPEEALHADIAAVPRIRDVSLERVSGTEIKITFTEYEPAGLWCDSEDHDRCVFVDATGYAFAAAPALSGGAMVRYRDPARAPAVRETAYTDVAAERFRAAEAALETNHGLSLAAIEQIAPGEVAYHLAGGGTLKVSESMPLTDVLANLATVLNSAEFSHLSSGDFNYIDLRYGDKVFVSEHDAPADTETATSTPE